MRQGMNPAKDGSVLQAYGRHRIIIPVYIPNLEGYFSSSLEILDLCLKSIQRTVDGRANVTLISNGSDMRVVAALRDYFAEGWIDQLIVNRENRGKVDALVSAARGAFEPFVTLTDFDVLYKPNWIDAVEDIFLQYPECGYVAPVPTGGIWTGTSTTILSALLAFELRFINIVPHEDLDRFARSIDRPDMYDAYKHVQMVVSRRGRQACVGAGHFAFTMRRELLAGMPQEPSLRAVSGNSEVSRFNWPCDQLGYWRLSTTRAFAYHMGNKAEPWMIDDVASCLDDSHEIGSGGTERPLPPIRRSVVAFIPWRLRYVLVRLIRKSGLYRWLFRMLGCPSTVDLG